MPWGEGNKCKHDLLRGRTCDGESLQMKDNVGERRGGKRETKGLGEHMTRWRCVWTRIGLCAADNLNAYNFKSAFTHTGFAGTGAGSGAGCNVIKWSFLHVVRSGRNAGAGSDIRKCSRR